MFLEFRTENYKSFRDEVVFSMIPAPKQKGLDYSILRRTVGKKEYKALGVAVIYGANAAGKTNIIGAMQSFRKIVLRGNILNSTPDPLNPADSLLELIPNSTLLSPKPVSFAIKFVHEGELIAYSIKLDLGCFLDADYKRSVLEESLYLDEKPVFVRKNCSVDFGKKNIFDEYINEASKNNFDVSRKIANDSLISHELFLVNGFKNVISPSLAELVFEYMNSFFMVFCHVEKITFSPHFSGKNVVLENDGLNAAAKEFGINSSKLVYRKTKDNPNAVLCSRIENSKADIPSDIFESYGTLRFVNMFPMLIDALQRGAILVVDEFDASIHPMVVINLISIFHNDEINKSHAQLVFNTHNPLYLNGNILRRDEIKFVERDDESGCSHHYSLSDFGTTGTTARKGKDYMRNYFVSEYGAIRDIDLSGIFMKLLGKKNAKKT